MNDHIYFPEVPAISLELINKCNLKCPYCGNRNLTRPRGEIPWEVLEKLVDDCKGGRHNIAWLHGSGEPLLYKRLEDAIRLIKQNNAGVASFGTNGTLLSKERIKKLLDAGLDSIYVSLDSLDPEVYKNTRGAHLPQVINNVQDLLKTVPSNFLVTIALMKSKLQQELDKNIEEFDRLFGRYPNVKLNKIENTVFPASETDYRRLQIKHFGCGMPNNFFTIVYDGRVSICCVDQDVQIPIGDIKENTVAEIWLSEKNQSQLAAVALGDQSCPDYCQKNCTIRTVQKETLAGPEMEEYVSVIFIKGKHYFKKKKFQTAALFVNRILEIMPDHDEALNISGVMAYERGEIEKASSLFARAIKSNPSIPKYHYRLGLAHEIRGNVVEAITSFERTLVLQPDFKQAYLKLIENLKKREKM